MSKLNPQYLFKDKEHHDPSALSDYDTLDFVSNDQHVYGEIMWPDGEYSALRPCVIMLHGFPGSARNDDIALFAVSAVLSWCRIIGALGAAKESI